jgi:tRNA threonylcarbamoyladenosine biosynthesis protein TsaB
MYVLAIDTSAGAVGAAIADGGGLIGQLELAAGRQASETLLPLVTSLLDLCGLSLAGMDALAVTTGPGSFTGLRIGLATVKAWVQALDKPLLAVSTLEALAYSAYERGHLLCPILNARRGELYAALFAEGKRLLPDMLITPEGLAERLTAYEGPVIFCGEGLAQAGERLAALLGSRMLRAPEQRQSFIAGAAALLGRDKFLAQDLADPILLEPAYLRPSAAEEQLAKGAGQQ